MKIKNIITTASAAAIAGLFLTAGSARGNVIVNGDFETGTLSGWTEVSTGSGSGVSIDSATPLAGDHSALQIPASGGSLTQSFTAFTGAATTSFIFAASDPGGASDRSMNITFSGNGSVNQINLRLVDVDTDGDGDFQAFSGIAGSGGSWGTVLSDAVTFGETTTFSLTINEYGVGFNYDLIVGGNIAESLTDVQDGVLSNFNELSFVASSLASGSTFEFDNVAVIPEPSTTVLIGVVSVLALFLRRRKYADVLK